MLRERAVSAFSTWEKELPKIISDVRFRFLLPRERRSVFERLVRLNVSTALDTHIQLFENPRR